jgi:hypothetical protein
VPHEGWVNGWCSAYYFRNVTPALRIVTVGPDVVVTTLNCNVPITVTSLFLQPDRTATGSSRPYRMTVTDGLVVALAEIYQP